MYLQGVIFLGIYFIFSSITFTDPDLIQKTWPALIDPMAQVTFMKMTRYWTVVEKNTLTVPFADFMLWNRLLWTGIGVLSLAMLYYFFPFSIEALTTKRFKQKPSESVASSSTTPLSIAHAAARLQFDNGTLWRQFRSLTQLRFFAVVKDIPFVAIVLFGMFTVVINGWQVGRFMDTTTYPVTYLMVEMVKGGFMMFLLIVTALYAGELVWKERTLKIDQIHDALPMPNWLNFVSSLSVLTAVQTVLLVAIMLTGGLLQVCKGFTNVEWQLYGKDLFLVLLPHLLQYSVLALLLHTVLPNKYLAHAAFIGILVGLTMLEKWSFENAMYQFGTVPPYTYSDMNGYGHFVQLILWYTLYWILFAGILAVLATLFARRGTDLSWASRLQQASEQLRFPIKLTGAAFIVAFLTVGAYIFYNTKLLNEYEDSKTQRTLQAQYERKYKQYEKLPQPKITAVDVNMDIYPERRAVVGRGSYTLLNKTSAPIAAIHILGDKKALKQLNFDRTASETLFDPDLGYHIYKLAEPLKPNGSVRLDFQVNYENPGFRSLERPEFAANGTFFDNNFLPHIGYNRNIELDDDDKRRDEGLQPVADLPKPEDAGSSHENLFSSDADWITFKATASTSPDQIAIAPGYLQREWTENDRRYFSYEMGATKILNFYSFVSGRYTVKREKWAGPQGNVNIEVYYDAKHPYNIDRMIEASKQGLDYFTKNFGSYQFRQYRIIEFPRYRTFAQAFPNTIPYSEGIGFIAHADGEDDLDMPLYVTAHELAHQWWGHQVIGRYAQGSNMLAESLAQYSALMVMEKAVGANNIRRYLKHELDRYLMERSMERRKEMPLGLVQRESYVWYNKGSLVMYALKDYLGEERLNIALRKYVEAVKFQEPPYTSSKEFVSALRDAAPDDMKYLLTDMFDTITLFDNRAVEANYTETPDKKYLVKIKVDTKKLRADELGVEKEIAINDLIDIGIFTGEGKTEKALFLEKRRMTQNQMTFEFTVDQIPTRAGIDPYNKLIDRQSDDNVVTVSNAKI